jgi:hypothetical protein
MRYDKIKDFFAFVPKDEALMLLKRRIYIVLFAALGVMAAYFMYVLSTVATIFLLLLDYAQYSFGLSWKVWSILGKMWFLIALVAGYLVGVSLGRYFWRVIYVEKCWKINKKKS